MVHRPGAWLFWKAWTSGWLQKETHLHSLQLRRGTVMAAGPATCAKRHCLACFCTVISRVPPSVLLPFAVAVGPPLSAVHAPGIACSSLAACARSAPVPAGLVCWLWCPVPCWYDPHCLIISHPCSTRLQQRKRTLCPSSQLGSPCMALPVRPPPRLHL